VVAGVAALQLTWLEVLAVFRGLRPELKLSRALAAMVAEAPQMVLIQQPAALVGLQLAATSTSEVQRVVLV
jgi:hypothetical protein